MRGKMRFLSRRCILTGQLSSEEPIRSSPVNPTSLSLLDRLKSARPSAPDWGRLQEIYLPLIRRWLGRVPGLGDETADLSQEVFLVVVRELPRFQRRRGSRSTASRRPRWRKNWS